jgi:hypothetical protein
MNVFQRFERTVQRALERPFTRLTGSKLQPVEVARVLGKELVANRRVSIDRVYAPNWFHAELAEGDFRQFEPFLHQLQREIAEDLIRQARRRGFIFVGDVTVELLASASLRAGDILATAEVRETAAAAPPTDGAPVARTSVFRTIDAPPTDPSPQAGAPAPADDAPTIIVRDEHGREQRLRMPGGMLRLGRGLDNDVILDGLSISRAHARLVRDGELFIEDLGSRNGTFVNGERIRRCRVGPGDRVRLGAAELRIEP